MSSASLALRGALISRLRADATLVALLGGPKVFDHVDERQRPPYLQIRESAKAWDTKTDHGKEHELELNAWSEGEGRKQCDEILGAVEASLRDADLAMTGHRMVNLRFETSAVFREEGGQTYCGYQRWRAVTEEV